MGVTWMPMVCERIHESVYGRSSGRSMDRCESMSMVMPRRSGLMSVPSTTTMIHCIHSRSLMLILSLMVSRSVSSVTVYEGIAVVISTGIVWMSMCSSFREYPTARLPRTTLYPQATCTTYMKHTRKVERSQNM